ncbi:g1156 [Coccomyxa viridis]|uniref:G1156 protein n=1 Tax=Coccomyxa viridis TaxID=1274662 RepID=A0ABP1FP73_9CHLO
MADKGTGKGGNLAVVLTEFNQDNPTAGLQVVERDIPKPKAGMGVIEEVGASAKTLLARFTSGIKAGQRVVAAPWPAAEGQGTWQQYVVVHVDNLYPVHPKVSN